MSESNVQLWRRNRFSRPLQSGVSIASVAQARPTFAQRATPRPATLTTSPPTPADVAVLLADWTGPYGGQPPFNKVKVAAFEPALTAAMTQYLTEIEAIASNPEPPTFDNTIAAQERSGKPFTRVAALYGVWTSSLNATEMKAVQNKMEPKLAEFADKITQNAKLFTRIDAVYQAREHSGLTPEQQRLTWVYWNSAAKEGAKLSPDTKARVTAINQQLAGLYAQFGQNLQHDEDAYVLYLKEADLVGTPAIGERRRRQGCCRQGPPRGIRNPKHPLFDRAVSHLFGTPRPARKGLAHVHHARR